MLLSQFTSVLLAQGLKKKILIAATVVMAQRVGLCHRGHNDKARQQQDYEQSGMTRHRMKK